LEYEADPRLTVADVIDEIYCLRNHIAHGDRVPDYYFRTPGRKAINGTIKKGEVLMESISSIVRQALLRILEKGLLNHFVDAAASEAYFTRNGLTTSAIGKRHYRCPS
jgi:hypothetical protein